MKLKDHLQYLSQIAQAYSMYNLTSNWLKGGGLMHNNCIRS